MNVYLIRSHSDIAGLAKLNFALYLTEPAATTRSVYLRGKITSPSHKIAANGLSAAVSKSLPHRQAGGEAAGGEVGQGGPVRFVFGRGADAADIGERDFHQQVFDAALDLGHRVPDGAAAELLAAFPLTVGAGQDGEWAVNGGDDLGDGDCGRRSEQAVAAGGAGVGGDKAGAGECLQQLRQQLGGDLVLLGDFFGVDQPRRLGGLNGGQVRQRKECVIGAF